MDERVPVSASLNRLSRNHSSLVRASFYVQPPPSWSSPTGCIVVLHSPAQTIGHVPAGSTPRTHTHTHVIRYVKPADQEQRLPHCLLPLLLTSHVDQAAIGKTQTHYFYSAPALPGVCVCGKSCKCPALRTNLCVRTGHDDDWHNSTTKHHPFPAEGLLRPQFTMVCAMAQRKFVLLFRPDTS